jgi:hypothetical protein
MDAVLQDVSVAIVDTILYKAKQFLMAAFCKVEDASTEAFFFPIDNSINMIYLIKL